MELELEAGSRLEGYPGTRGNLTISGVATPQIVRDTRVPGYPCKAGNS